MSLAAVYWPNFNGVTMALNLAAVCKISVELLEPKDCDSDGDSGNSGDSDNSDNSDSGNSGCSHAVDS